jgi:hypothetical protein
MIAIESVIFLVVGVMLAVVLALAFGWGRGGKGVLSAPRGHPVKLVRSARTAQGREELLLTVNDRVILAANNEGVRYSDYAEQVEQIEAIATRLAAALGTPVEFARTSARKPGDETGIPVGEVPYASDEEVERVEARRRAGSGPGKSARDAEP